MGNTNTTPSLSKSKFISASHEAYNASVAINIESFEKLTNLVSDSNKKIYMQLKDLQIATWLLKDVDTNKAPKKNIQITTLDKTLLANIEETHKELTKDNESKESIKNNEYKNIFSGLEIQEIRNNKANGTNNKANGLNNNIINLMAIITKLIGLLQDDDKEKTAKELQNLFKALKTTIAAYKDAMPTLPKGYELPNTDQAITRSKVALEEVLNLIKTSENVIVDDIQNKFRKDLIVLSAHILVVMHSPLIANILAQTASKGLLRFIGLLIFGAPLGPLSVFVSIVCLMYEINLFFKDRQLDDEILKEAYKIYSVVMGIYERLDYKLASLIALEHTAVGNLISIEQEDSISYYLFADYNLFSSSYINELLKDKVENYSDTLYRANFSLNTNNLAHTKTLFETNNLLSNQKSSTSKKNTLQFSTFSLQSFYIAENSKWISQSSSFAHLHNILLKFDSFLFVKSSSFSSLLANDLLMQSFKQSKQGDSPRMKKNALFLTSCLPKDKGEYQIQQHIKTTLQSHPTIQKNVLFLSSVYRVEKQSFFETLFSKIWELMSPLKYKSYWIFENTFYGYMDDFPKKENFFTLIAKDNESQTQCTLKEHCFIDTNIQQIADLFQYMLDYLVKYEDSNKNSQDYEKNIQEIFQLGADISKIFSHFSTNANPTDIKDYQKNIDDEYEKQQEDLRTFFKQKYFTKQDNGKETRTEKNIFFKNKEIQSLCLELLARYFNKDDNFATPQLTKEQEQTELFQAEEAIPKQYKQTLQEMTCDYVTSFLPLNKNVFNCLSDDEIYAFCRYIIHKVYENAINNTDTTDDANRIFIQIYIFNLKGIFASIAIGSQDDSDKILDQIKKQPKEFMQTLIEFIYEIKQSSKEVAQDVFKETLKESLNTLGKKESPFLAGTGSLIVGFATAESIQKIIESMQKIIEEAAQEVIKGIADELDEIFFDTHGISLKTELVLIPVAALVSSVAQKILDRFFPATINNIKEIQSKVALFYYALNKYTDTPYAKCQKGQKYLVLPIQISQTLINADLKAILLGGCALNSGFCMHTPSIGLLVENEEHSIFTLKQTLKCLMSDKVNFSLLDGRKRSIIKEAYAKLWYYLELGENKAIESYLRNEVQIQPRYYKLDNLTSSAYIPTKLKKSKKLDNEDENFIQAEGNSKGKILFSRDFLIQLKRIAEYNYSVYMRKPILNHSNTKKPSLSSVDKDDQVTPKEGYDIVAGNLIYDEDFIPTTIDIKD